MDSRETINDQIRKQFHGKKAVTSKYLPKFPESAERDYQRFANAFLADIYGAVLKESIPDLLQALKESDTELRTDAKGTQAKENEKKRSLQRWRNIDNTVIRLRRVINTIRQKLDRSIGMYQTKKKLNAIANATRKLTNQGMEKGYRKDSWSKYPGGLFRWPFLCRNVG